MTKIVFVSDYVCPYCLVGKEVPLVVILAAVDILERVSYNKSIVVLSRHSYGNSGWRERDGTNGWNRNTGF